MRNSLATSPSVGFAAGGGGAPVSDASASPRVGSRRNSSATANSNPGTPAHKNPARQLPVKCSDAAPVR